MIRFDMKKTKPIGLVLEFAKKKKTKKFEPNKSDQERVNLVWLGSDNWLYRKHPFKIYGKKNKLFIKKNTRLREFFKTRQCRKICHIKEVIMQRILKYKYY